MKTKYLVSTILFSIISLLFPNFVLSQENKTIKTIKNEILKADTTDEKARLLGTLTEEYYKSSKVDSAAFYIQKAIDLSFSLPIQEVADLHLRKAEISYQIGTYKIGLIAIEKSLNIYESQNLKSEKKYANYLYYHGLLNRILGNKSKALKSLTKASNLTDSYKLKAQIFSTLSDVYISLGDNENALNYANRITEKPMVDSISQVYVAKSYAIVSNIYASGGDNDKAFEFEKKALAIYIENKNQLGIASTLVNISHALHELGKHNEALEYLERAKTENAVLKNKYIEAGITLNNAENLAKLKRYTSAYPLFDLAAEQFENLGITQGITEAYLEKSKTLYTENKIKETINFAEIALNMAQENNHINLEEASYLFLYQVYKQQEGSTKALFYFEKYSETKDAILKEEKQQSLENLKVKFDIQRLENEIQLKDNQIKLSEEKEKTSLYLKLLLGLGIISLLFFVYRQYKLIKAKKKTYEAEKELTKIKRKQLQNEIKLKKREVTDFAIQINDKNEILYKIKKNISSVYKTSDTETKPKLRKVITDINNTIEVNQSKIAMYSKIEEVNNDFYSTISQKYPKLSKRETEIATYLRLNMSSKQIANQFNITQQSVNNYRLSVRKKLNLKTSDNLSEFLQSL